jgi:hypothetical protein
LFRESIEKGCGKTPPKGSLVQCQRAYSIEPSEV